MVSQQKFEDGLSKLRFDVTQDLMKSIDALKNTIIDNLVEANKVLQQKVQVLGDRVTKLESDLQATQQYSRQNNILISGIPAEVEHEQLQEIVINIMETCNSSVSLTSRDFEACHRLSKKGNAVVARLVNRTDVENTLKNRSAMKNLNKQDLGLPESTQGIYLNEHLTPQNAKLSFYCRKLKKKRLIEKYSTTKGIIKILQTMDGAKWVTIGHLSDLQQLFPDLEENIKEL